MSNINQLVQESILFESKIFSDKTISVDLHKFESGEADKLFIIGMSGSGKTTLGEHLAKQYKCKYYDTDDISHDMRHDEPFDPNPPVGAFFDELRIDLPIILKRKERAIIGGVHLPGISRSPKLAKDIRDLIFYSPMIFIGTSVSKATFNIFKRSIDKNKKYEGNKTIKGAISHTMFLSNRNYTFYDKSIQQLKSRRLRLPNVVVEPFNIPRL